MCFSSPFNATFFFFLDSLLLLLSILFKYILCSRIWAFKFRYICNCKLWKLYQRRVLPYAGFIICYKNIPFMNAWQISKISDHQLKVIPSIVHLEFILSPIYEGGFHLQFIKMFPLGDFTLYKIAWFRICSTINISLFFFYYLSPRVWNFAMKISFGSQVLWNESATIYQCWQSTQDTYLKEKVFATNLWQ